MGLKKFLAASAVAVCLLPLSAAAQTTLSASAQQQVSNLAVQLFAILTALSQAQAEGSAYLSSPVFQAQAAVWNQQVTQIAAQLVTILSAAQSGTTVPTMGSTGSSCPNFSRDLSIGAQGGDVAALQLFLANDKYARFLDGANGFFDADTEAAVQRFQAGYGVVSDGSPATTGYGRVGPGTRAMINSLCANTYLVSVPPITVPSTGNNGLVITPAPSPTYYPPSYTSPSPSPTTPSPLPTAIGYSTGELKLVPNLTGNSGGPNSVGFSVNMLPNSACSGAAYSLSFGDGQTQNITSNTSCSDQILVITHVYPQTGQYTATLSSGSFATTLVVQVQAANNTLSLSVAADPSASRVGNITATYNPGVTCTPGTYTLSFGDGQSQGISFNANGCIPQTQILSHTYPNTSLYLITATDSGGHAITAQFTPVTH